MKQLLLVGLMACSSTQRTEPEPTPTPEPRAEPAREPASPPSALEEFVTTAEIWAPDESAMLGVVVAMREAPTGTAGDFVMPSGDFDPGDGRAVLFGARLIREDGAILSATTEERTRRFVLERSALPGPVQVWTFDEAELKQVLRVEPCTSCEPWQSPPARYVLVLSEGQQLDATPEPSWTIAISP